MKRLFLPLLISAALAMPSPAAFAQIDVQDDIDAAIADLTQQANDFVSGLFDSLFNSNPSPGQTAPQPTQTANETIETSISQTVQSNFDLTQFYTAEFEQRVLDPTHNTTSSLGALGIPDPYLIPTADADHPAIYLDNRRVTSEAVRQQIAETISDAALSSAGQERLLAQQEQNALLVGQSSALAETYVQSLRGLLEPQLDPLVQSSQASAQSAATANITQDVLQSMAEQNVSRDLILSTGFTQVSDQLFDLQSELSYSLYALRSQQAVGHQLEAQISQQLLDIQLLNSVAARQLTDIHNELTQTSDHFTQQTFNQTTEALRANTDLYIPGLFAE